MPVRCRNRWMLLAAPLLVAAACSPRVQELRMDPMEFTTSRTVDGVVVDVMDAEIPYLKDGIDYEPPTDSEASQRMVLRYAPMVLGGGFDDL